MGPSILYNDFYKKFLKKTVIYVESDFFKTDAASFAPDLPWANQFPRLKRRITTANCRLGNPQPAAATSFLISGNAVFFPSDKRTVIPNTEIRLNTTGALESPA